jgi:hypothetical protein
MKMKRTRKLLFCLSALLFAVPTLRSQDFSKYRALSLGTSLPVVLKHTGQKMSDVKLIHSRPALIQEVTWWPTNTTGTTSQAGTVREIVFSLYNGELYKMAITYDRSSTEGLTTPDMMKAVTEKYGPVTNFVLAIDSGANDRYDLRAKTIATWEDSQYAIDLVRSAFTDDFGLVIYSKRGSADAELAIAESVKLEELERPKREADRHQRETTDLEVTRQKNRKIFQP